MVGSMFAAIAGLKAHQTKMDVIGNNIANVNTWGYKAHSANFMDAAYRTMVNGAAGTAATDPTGRGGVNPSQIGYGANVGSVSVDYSTGNWNYTGWGADCMIDGPGFFVVSKTKTDPKLNNGELDGASGVMLSRVITVYPDSTGYLTDSQGNYLMGYGVNADGTKIDGLKALTIPTGKTYSSYNVATDGTISGVLASSTNVKDKVGSVEVLGRIAVASVQNPSGLQKQQGSLYSIGDNAGSIVPGESNTATGAVMGGYLEMSNTNLATEMANMITTQRGYQANTKIITVTDQMLEELVNMKR